MKSANTATRYGVFAFANLLAASTVNCIGVRWSLAFGAFIYTIFLAGFLFVNGVYLFSSSALHGIGSARKKLFFVLNRLSWKIVSKI